VVGRTVCCGWCLITDLVGCCLGLAARPGNHSTNHKPLLKLACMPSQLPAHTCSSFLLSITPVSGTDVTLSYWPATTNVANAANVSASTTVSRPAPVHHCSRTSQLQCSGRHCINLQVDQPSPPAHPPHMQVCTGTADVIGGQVVGLPSEAISTCPAGSYNDPNTVDGCRPW